jgi:ADP-ribose pyrophosphatase
MKQRLPITLTTETLDHNPFWSYEHDTFKKSDGTIGHYYYGATPGAVFIIPLLPNGRIIFVKQYRYLKKKWSLEFPGGGIEPGESLLAAAKRELYEETGYISKNLHKIGSFESMNGLFKEQMTVFIAQVDKQAGKPQEEATGSLKILSFTPRQTQSLIAKNTVWDGQTIAAYGLALTRELIRLSK